MNVEFLRFVCGDGWHSLCSDRGGEFHTIGHYDDPDKLLEAAKRENEPGGNVWFGVHPIPDPPAKGRGDADLVEKVHVLVADLDWHDPDQPDAHKANPADLPTEAILRELLARFEHPPSAVVNSGHGLQLYYVLASPVAAAEGHALTLRLHAALGKAGMPADRSDLASVLRPPGTVSRKPDCDEVDVVVEQLDENIIHTPQYLAKYLPKAERKKRTTVGPSSNLDEGHWWAEGPIGAGHRHKSLAAAAGWCREMGLSRDEAVPTVRDAWHRHRPQRHTEDKVIEVLDDVYSRYPAGSRLAELRRDDDPEATINEDLRITEDLPLSAEAPPRRVRLTPASSIPPRPVRWLWHDRLPVGELTLTPGRGGLGKSTFHSWLIAQITRGSLDGAATVSRGR